jgi:hypothetical protein
MPRSSPHGRCGRRDRQCELDAALGNIDGTAGFSSFDFCRTQCSYDMPVASPPGKPDEVWIGGATQYQEASDAHSPLPLERPSGHAFDRCRRPVHGSDGRARHDWESIHPDIHEFAAPGGVTFIASDGLTRTNGTYVDFSSDCDDRNNRSRAGELPGLPHLAVLDSGAAADSERRPAHASTADLAVDPTDPVNDLSPARGQRLAVLGRDCLGHQRPG